MTKKRPKTTDALMRYLREEKGISISGSSQKRKLMNIGYYHGYKGYRYIGKASNSIHYTNFDELMAVYEFDAQLKALFYPYVMQIETALKSYVLEVVVSQVNSDSFIDVYNKLLDNYKAFSTAGSVYSDFKQRKKAEDVVFDTRFRTNKIDRQVCNAISNATNVPNLNFETITDYLVLIVYLLSLLRISKNDSKRLISSYIECTERLRKAIPANVYSQIIRTDNSSKVVALRKFIWS